MRARRRTRGQHEIRGRRLPVHPPNSVGTRERVPATAAPPRSPGSRASACQASLARPSRALGATRSAARRPLLPNERDGAGRGPARPGVGSRRPRRAGHRAAGCGPSASRRWKGSTPRPASASTAAGRRSSPTTRSRPCSGAARAASPSTGSSPPDHSHRQARGAEPESKSADADAAQRMPPAPSEQQVGREAGQEGLTAETGVTVTLLSHSAHTPSFRATWCLPECGSPMTIVGYVTGSLPDTQ
jgi:hypothetical protein